VNTYLSISSLLNFLASLFLMAILYLGRGGSVIRRRFFYFLLTLVGWSGSYFLWRVSSAEAYALLFCQWLTIFSIFIPATLFHFSLAMSGISMPWMLRVGYLSALILALLVPFGLVISGVSAKAGHQYWPDAGLLAPAYIAFFMLYAGLSLAVLVTGKRLHVGRRASDHLFVIFTLFVGFAGGATNFPLWYDLPLQPFGNILVSVYLLMMGYGLLHRRITGLRADYFKAFAGLILSASAALFYILLFTLYRALIDRPIDDRALAKLVILALLVSALVFWGVPRLKTRTERILDGVFRKERISGLNELHGLPTRLSDLVEEDAVLAEAGEAIAAHSGASGVAILTLQSFARHYTCRFGSGRYEALTETLRLPAASPLVERLRYRVECIVFDQIYGELGDPFYQALVGLKREHGVSLIVPIFANHDIYGMILLGDSQSSGSWSEEQVAVLFNIGSQIGLGMRARDFERRSGEVDKLVALGTMAAGLAHEIRNPLVSVQTLVSLMDKGRSVDSLKPEFRKVLVRDVQRIESIVDGVALYSNNHKAKRIPIDVLAVLRESIEINAESAGRADVRIVLETGGLEEVVVLADFDQLVQVFHNLIENAVQALVGTPDPFVQIGAVVRADGPESRRGWVEISVLDNGPGIPESIQGRIFDPFITSKDTGSRESRNGMGLGLAISKRIIETHEGVITVDNDSGPGACFIVSLKLANRR